MKGGQRLARGTAWHGAPGGVRARFRTTSGHRLKAFARGFFHSPPPRCAFERSSGRSRMGSEAQQNPQVGVIFVERRRLRRADSILHRDHATRGTAWHVLWDIPLCPQALACGTVHQARSMHPKKRGHN